MTAQRIRKAKRARGTNTHGGGSTKKRRGSGNRGGYGNAGTGKRADHRKFTVLQKFGLSYFGKHGFKKKNVSPVKAINVGDLPQTPKVNLTAMGIQKLLGSGTPQGKYEITVATCSARAKEKIEKLGGTVLVTTPSEVKAKEE